MFRPVGSQPPSVYWRRRLVFLASVIVLIVLIALTVRVLLSDDSASPTAAGNSGTSSGAPSRTTTPRSPVSSSTSVATSRTKTSSASTSKSGSTSGTSASKSTSAPPKECVPGSLGLSTATDKTSYAMTDKPTLSLLVKNKAGLPCVQDLGDAQIVMRVYNGESRVWGSHDCRVDPTPNKRTLAARSTVRLNIVWTGFSSLPNNCTNRQRVSAGTYTLYASLAGKEATAAQFTITP